MKPPRFALAQHGGTYRESRVIAEFAKQYGFSNVAIETFGQPTMAWQPTQGELWMTAPKSVKLFDIHDLALALASLKAAVQKGAKGVLGVRAIGYQRAIDFPTMTALQIRDFLSGEFTALPMADVMAVLRARETAGAIKLAPKSDTGR